jgi:hypothetical protein
MFTLPTVATKAERINPKRLMIYSKPKAGKTTAISLLEGTCIIDIEKGTEYVSAIKINIRELAAESKKSPLAVLFEIAKQIQEVRPYKRIALDTITVLEDLCLPYAKQLYNGTPQGAQFKGNILDLPNGGGYRFLYQAMDLVLAELDKCADEVIYCGHLKDIMINKDGKEVSAKEIDLTGKYKSMLSARVDAIGLLYRDGNQCILSFETSDEVICGARPEHLKNKKIVLTEIVDGKMIEHWDQVYLK